MKQSSHACYSWTKATQNNEKLRRPGTYQIVWYAHYNIANRHTLYPLYHEIKQNTTKETNSVHRRWLRKNNKSLKFRQNLFKRCFVFLCRDKQLTGGDRITFVVDEVKKPALPVARFLVRSLCCPRCVATNEVLLAMLSRPLQADISGNFHVKSPQ